LNWFDPFPTLRRAFRYQIATLILAGSRASFLIIFAALPYFPPAYNPQAIELGLNDAQKHNHPS
jgi:hypothetical protein